MGFQAITLILYFVTLASASQGKLINNETCTEEWQSGGPTTDDCLKACAQFSAKAAGAYHEYSYNNCFATITQITRESFAGQVVSDACGDLVSKCPRTNATSEFRGTGGPDAGLDYGGTLRITWGQMKLPGTEREGVTTEPTAATGDYVVPLQNCSDALQQLFQPDKVSGSEEFLTKVVGSCNVTITSNLTDIRPTKTSRGGQDILTVPANCNASDFCRTFVNSTIGDHQGAFWLEILTFRQHVLPVK